MSSIGGVLWCLRVVRWVALVQQKEYRLDRIVAFLQTPAGSAEAQRWIPPVNELKRGSVRRPYLTARAVITLAITAVSEGVLSLGWVVVAQQLELSNVLFFAGFVLLYISVPTVVICVAVPQTMLVQWYASWLLSKAGKKLENSTSLVIGITGSYGKTSTKLLLAHVLSAKKAVFFTPRSFNTRLSIAQCVLDSYSGQELAIIEYGAYKVGEIAAIAARLQPTTAVLTGFAPQHLGLFGSEAAILTAKQELVQALPHKATVYLANTSAEKILPAEIRPDLQRVYCEGLDLTGSLENGYLVVHTPKIRVVTRLVGLQYLETLKTVWAVARAVGVTKEQIITQLQSFVPPSQFIQKEALKSGAAVINDGGTANPQGFLAAIALLSQLTAAGKKYLVTPGIVDLGSQSGAVHAQLAAEAKAVASEIWHLGSEGRHEFTTVFGQQYLSDQDVITGAFSRLKKGDILLIEGRMPAWFEQLYQSNKERADA